MSLQPPAIPFLGAQPDVRPGCPVILGVPYDHTASFRKGTRNGPDDIRRISDAGIETYSPPLDRDVEDVLFCDLGNLSVGTTDPPEDVVAALYEATAACYAAGQTPVVLGGEHSISPGAIRAAFDAYPDLVVLQFDAHADLRDAYEGSSHSHACAMRRTLDFLPSDRLLQIGIRSGTRDEFQEMARENRYVEPTGAALAARLAEAPFADAPIYVTFDIDAFDPSEVPGTGTPEAGGILWPDFAEFVQVLRDRNIVGVDLVELSPDMDPSGISTVLAAKMLREFLLLLA